MDTPQNIRPKDSYDNPEGAQHFLNFLASEDGVTFQKVLYDAFKERLGDNRQQRILDAACGPGWLSYELSKEYPNIESCDGSKYFIEHAKKTYPNLKIKEMDLAEPLPYPPNTFDTIILSMAAHDVEDQTKTFSHLKTILKPEGKLMLTIVNPYYAFPVGVWKRGAMGRIMSRMPQLIVRPYHWFGHQERHFIFNNALQCYFYKLSEHFNNMIEAGFSLSHYKDLECEKDSKRYNLQYRMHRYPIIIFVELMHRLRKD
jgi:ubiquinone/menaquinone biosynthesis C-methylase UbiE